MGYIGGREYMETVAEIREKIWNTIFAYQRAAEERRSTEKQEKRLDSQLDRLVKASVRESE